MEPKIDRRGQRTNQERIGQPSKSARGSGPVLEIRREANATQKALSAATGVSERTIRDAEKAGGFPSDPHKKAAILDFACKKGLSVPKEPES